MINAFNYASPCQMFNEYSMFGSQNEYQNTLLREHENKYKFYLNLLAYFCCCSEDSTTQTSYEEQKEGETPDHTDARIDMNIPILSKPIRERRRRYELPDISSNVRSLRKLVELKKIDSFTQTRKQLRGEARANSRRSKFRGVSRNGDNWQALVNIGPSKKYLGTFQTESEAAIAYDFYAMALHRKKAKTNYSYSSKLILKMIESYEEDGMKLKPHLFVSHLHCSRQI